MNMFARFDENPAMTLQDIKETKRYGRTDARTDGQRENSIPTTNKVCGGYKIILLHKFVETPHAKHSKPVLRSWWWPVSLKMLVLGTDRSRVSFASVFIC